MNKNSTLSDISETKEAIIEYCLLKKTDLTISEMNNVVDAITKFPFEKSDIIENYNYVNRFFSTFGKYLSKSQVSIICTLLNSMDLTNNMIANFLNEYDIYLDSNDIYKFISKLIRMGELDNAYYVSYQFYNILDNNDINALLCDIKNAMSPTENTHFIDFLTKYFNPFNKKFLDIINTYFSFKEAPLTDDILYILRNYIKFNTVKELIMDDLEREYISSVKVLSNYIDELSASDIIKILNHSMAKDNIEEINNVIELILENRKEESLINLIIECVPNIIEEFQKIIIPLLISNINKEQFNKLKIIILNSDSLDALYILCKTVPLDKDYEDLIDKLISSNNVKEIYEASLIANGSVQNKFKEALKRNQDDYYIVLYGINVDKSILIEYYQDTNLILDLMIAMQKENKIPENLKEEINTKRLKIEGNKNKN